MLLEGSGSHHPCQACVTRDETQPSVVWMVLKARASPKLVMLLPLMLGIHWLVFSHRSFSILILSYTLQQLFPSSYRDASISPCSPNPWHLSRCIFKHKGEGAWGYTQALKGMLEQAKAIPPQRRAGTRWIEKMCQGADMLFHGSFPKTQQPV